MKITTSPAEQAARGILTNAGLKVLSEHFTCPIGDVHFVAQDANGALRFVAVSAVEGRVPPAVSIDDRMGSRIESGVCAWLVANGMTDRIASFDLMDVGIRSDRALIRWVRDAWSPEHEPMAA